MHQKRCVWKHRAKAEGTSYLFCWTSWTVWEWRGYIWSGYSTDTEELGSDQYESEDWSDVFIGPATERDLVE